MKFFVVVFAPVLLFCGCGNNVKLNIQSNGKITLIDSTELTNGLRTYIQQEREGFYPIYYIGEKTDTIRLGQPVFKFSYGQKDYSDRSDFAWPGDSTMEIFIDTSIILSHKVVYKQLVKLEEDEVIDSIKLYQAFPVFIYNKSDSLLKVGKFNVLTRTVKQVNENGRWRDIESPITFFCGTGARSIVMEPHQMLIAKLLRYRGEHQMKCRLKFSIGDCIVYSNTFTDYIDKRQLTQEL